MPEVEVEEFQVVINMAKVLKRLDVITFRELSVIVVAMVPPFKPGEYSSAK